MNRGAIREKRTRFVAISLIIFAFAVAVVALSGGTAVANADITESAMQKLEPALQAMITEQYSKTIPVIVQKAGDSDQAEQLLAALGGTVSYDLTIINAFATELESEALLQLASSPQLPTLAWMLWLKIAIRMILAAP